MALPETRALRLRLVPRDDELQFEPYLEAAAEAGFNTIVIDAFRGGYPFFPSAVSGGQRLPAIHPAWKDSDPVGELCSLAVRLEIPVFAAVQVLYVGHLGRAGRSPLLRGHRKWLAEPVPRRLADPNGPEPDSVFLCPGNREVRDYLCRLFSELCDRYPIDGLFLEHLRFPGGVGRNSKPLCFCASCRAGALETLQLPLLRRRPPLSTEEIGRIAELRSEQMDDLLHAIRARTRKGMLLRHAVVRAEDAVRNVAPDSVDAPRFCRWVYEDLVDSVCIESYGSADEVKAVLDSEQLRIPRRALLLAELPADDIRHGCQRLEAARRGGSTGFVFGSDRWIEADELAMVARYFPPDTPPCEPDLFAAAAAHIEGLLAGAEAGKEFVAQVSPLVKAFAKSREEAESVRAEVRQRLTGFLESAISGSGERADNRFACGIRKALRLLEASALS